MVGSSIPFVLLLAVLASPGRAAGESATGARQDRAVTSGFLAHEEDAVLVGVTSRRAASWDADEIEWDYNAELTRLVVVTMPDVEGGYDTRLTLDGLGATFAPGTTYPLDRRVGGPRLTIEAPGSAYECRQGSVTIHEFDVEADRFWFSFRVQCGGEYAPYNSIGELRLDSVAPTVEDVLAPGPVELPDADLDETTGPLELPLMNLGAMPVQVAAPYVMGPDADEFTAQSRCTSIPAAGRCPVGLTWDPDTTPGGRAATVHLPVRGADGGRGELTIPLTGLVVPGISSSRFRTDTAAGTTVARELVPSDHLGAYDYEHGVISVLGPGFYPPLGEELAVGRYEGAHGLKSFPQDFPVLKLRGLAVCRTEDNWFEIHQLERDELGTITAFSATYEEHCPNEEHPDRSFVERGYVAYRADGVPPQPEGSPRVKLTARGSPTRGQDVVLDARVSGELDPGRVVLWRLRPDGGRVRLDAAHPSAGGTATFTTTPAEDTTYEAVLIDEPWQPRSRVRVIARPEVVVAPQGFERVRGRTFVYQARERLRIVAMRRPDPAGCLRGEAQVRRKGRWVVQAHDRCLRQDANGVSHWSLRSKPWRGERGRVRALPAVDDLDAKASDWVSFKVRGR